MLRCPCPGLLVLLLTLAACRQASTSDYIRGGSRHEPQPHHRVVQPSFVNSEDDLDLDAATEGRAVLQSVPESHADAAHGMRTQPRAGREVEGSRSRPVAPSPTGADPKSTSYQRVPSLYIFLYTTLMALASGLGAVPFFVFGRLRPHWAGIANAVAVGVMLAASFDLLHEGGQHSPALTILGMVIGALFIKASQDYLSQFEDASFEDLQGADARKAMLIVAVMAAHAFGEGSGVGVSFSGQRGWAQGLLVTIAIGLHNVPEGMAVAGVMMSKGSTPGRALYWTLMCSFPQALVSVPSYLFVETFSSLLPVALGFAAGCMVWIAFAELLPDALESADHGHVATAVSFSAAWLQGLSMLISRLEQPSGALASPLQADPGSLFWHLVALLPCLLAPCAAAVAAVRLLPSVPVLLGAAAGAMGWLGAFSLLALVLKGRASVAGALAAAAGGAALASMLLTATGRSKEEEEGEEEEGKGKEEEGSADGGHAAAALPGTTLVAIAAGSNGASHEWQDKRPAHAANGQAQWAFGAHGMYMNCGGHIEGVPAKHAPDWAAGRLNGDSNGALLTSVHSRPNRPESPLTYGRQEGSWSMEHSSSGTSLMEGGLVHPPKAHIYGGLQRYNSDDVGLPEYQGDKHQHAGAAAAAAAGEAAAGTSRTAVSAPFAAAVLVSQGIPIGLSLARSVASSPDAAYSHALLPCALGAVPLGLACAGLGRAVSSAKGWRGPVALAAGIAVVGACTAVCFLVGLPLGKDDAGAAQQASALESWVPLTEAAIAGAMLLAATRHAWPLAALYRAKRARVGLGLALSLGAGAAALQALLCAWTPYCLR